MIVYIHHNRNLSVYDGVCDFLTFFGYLAVWSAWDDESSLIVSGYPA